MTELRYDIVVVGAGIGGIYAVRTFVDKGFRVLGIEGAPEVGGTWYHNAYPGARVDVVSTDYCYLEPSLYREWRWSERYATQPELLRYINHVADLWDVRKDYAFNTWVTGAQWDPDTATYVVSTSDDRTVRCQFLVMATGPLSNARTPRFEGLDDFRGKVLRTSHWPHEPVDLSGKRVGLVGTGSSGAQSASALAKIAGHLTIFQRTPHYVFPARNGAVDPDYLAMRLDRADDYQQHLLHTPGGMDFPPPVGPASDFSPNDQKRLLEERWAMGGTAILYLFTDMGTNTDSNTVVADFVRSKIRETVRDPQIAERLLPHYPVASRRPIFVDGYYESFGQDNVSFVDVRDDPIVCITADGIETANSHHDLDVIILAIGFNAFTGALQAANIRNEAGAHPTDVWARGPQTYLGLMTHGFPNLFFLTGPGSPSVLANMNLGNVFHVDVLSGLFTHMREHSYARVEATAEAQDAWTKLLADLARSLIVYNLDAKHWMNYETLNNWLVHVNVDDGSRAVMCYPGGLATYVERCEAAIANDYEGFAFDKAAAQRTSTPGASMRA